MQKKKNRETPIYLKKIEKIGIKEESCLGTTVYLSVEVFALQIFFLHEMSTCSRSKRQAVGLSNWKCKIYRPNFFYQMSVKITFNFNVLL